MASDDVLPDFELRAGDVRWVVEMDRPLEDDAWSIQRHDHAGCTELSRHPLFEAAVWHLAEQSGADAAAAASACTADEDASHAWFARWALEDGGWEALVKIADAGFAVIDVTPDGVRRLGTWDDPVLAIQMLSVDQGDV